MRHRWIDRDKVRANRPLRALSAWAEAAIGRGKKWGRGRRARRWTPVVASLRALPRPPRGDSRARAAYDFYAPGASVRRVYGRTGRTRSGGSKARGVTRQTRRALVFAVRICFPRGYSPIHRKNVGGCRNWSVKLGVIRTSSHPLHERHARIIQNMDERPLGAGQNTRTRTCRGPRAPPRPAPRALGVPAVGLGKPDTPI